MAKRIDLTGHRFDRLVVIGFPERRPGTGNVYWRCRCDCGKETVAGSSNLRTGKTRSCGCFRSDYVRKHSRHYRHPNKLPKGHASCNFLMNRYRQGAVKRGFTFTLSKDEFREITAKNCAYCGWPPSMSITSPRGHEEWIYNGVDRIDSTKGYESDNVNPCCSTCNYAKRDMSLADFRAWIANLVAFQKSQT